MTSLSIVSSILSFTVLIRFINNNDDKTTPTSIATVKSTKMVRKNVVSNMKISKGEDLNIETKERHSLMLYATTISIPARQDIGMRIAHCATKSIIIRRIIA